MIDELPEMWIDREIALQKRKLADLKSQKLRFSKVTDFDAIIQMREEFIEVAERKLAFIKVYKASRNNLLKNIQLP